MSRRAYRPVNRKKWIAASAVAVVAAGALALPGAFANEPGAGSSAEASAGPGGAVSVDCSAGPHTPPVGGATVAPETEAPTPLPAPGPAAPDPEHTAPGSEGSGRSYQAEGHKSAGNSESSPADSPEGVAEDCAGSSIGAGGETSEIASRLVQVQQELAGEPERVKTLSTADLEVLWANRDASLKWAMQQEHRGGRALWGNEAPRLDNHGAVAPDAAHPGSVFSPALFDRLKKAPLSEFLQIRQAALSAPSSSTQDQGLRNSFYANGCTGISQVMNLPQEIVDACIRHDFAYTVGPNIAARTQQDPSALRREADDQLWDDMRASGHPYAATVFWAGLRAGGWMNFAATPEEGDEISSIVSGRPTD
ncbi:hypothetical protein [Streptomyces sp. NBC_01092]|uniref:hypothetical protein n=1 Tax=Streptomyces sp. NBC_01092 TaxID=2903748 RepID=UPI0038632918|nr:hypothetical protein OG254_25030 [Streptomyces sp. NBC_01092]